jgi:hypothetical protein
VTEEAPAIARIRAIFAEMVAAGYRAEMVEGASDEEIDAVAAAQGVAVVPAAMREILRIMGRRPGLLMAATLFGVETADPEVKEGAGWCLEEADERGLPHGIRDPAGMLVIAAAHPESYSVIDGSDLAEPDPPVWVLVESGEVRRSRDSVTHWFAMVAEGLFDTKRRLADMRALGCPDLLREPYFRW